MSEEPSEPPHNGPEGPRGPNSEEQKSIARQIFDELALKNAEKNPGTNEVLEPRFREELASNGFKGDDIDVIIKDMEKDGLERVSTELDGVRCDILRKVNLHDNNYC